MTPTALEQQAFGDILPPPAVADAVSWWLWGAILLAVCGAAFAGVYLRNRNPHWRAGWQLRHLAIRIQKQAGTPRTLAFAIADALRTGLSVHQLRRAGPRDEHEPQWRSFYANLARACYDATPPSWETLGVIAEQAHRWLRR